MKFNIVPMYSNKDECTKDEAKKTFPKWCKIKFYTDPIPNNKNTMMMTGIHPLHPAIQVAVLDFDGVNHKSIGWNILSKILDYVKFNKLEPYIIRRTGNGGFHLIYICDNEYIFRNEHNRGINEFTKSILDYSVGDIDVRGNGGLVYWDCKFSDTEYYRTIFKSQIVNIVSSTHLHEFIESFRIKEVKEIVEKTFKIEKFSEVQSSEKLNIENCIDYGIPYEKFSKFLSLRSAIRDIWTGNYIIKKTSNEFKKWAIFWRECLSRGFTESEIMNRLRSGVQPEFDEEDTILQLKCLKYKDIPPASKYYFDVFPEYKSFYR